jgi:Thioredoxin domain-containing protein
MPPINGESQRLTLAWSIPASLSIVANDSGACRGDPYPEHMDVTDATFQAQVLDRSSQVPVVVDLWAEWCGPCRSLTPIIEKVVAETGGQVELAKVDIDANPGIAQSFKVQSIPAVYGIS